MDRTKTKPDELRTLAQGSETLADNSKTQPAEGPECRIPSGRPHIPDHELLKRIGQGSYGEVWLARNVMGTYRAVKFVYRATFEHARPFEREFNGIKKFEPLSRSHDGFVDVLQVGRTEEYFFYVMELADDQVTGQEIDPERYEPKTLRSMMKETGRLPFETCVELGISLTQALGRLHQHGLIHRDIKPSNIIFVNGIAKLADIGLVAEQSEAKSFVGTEGFIPPEGPGTPQADIYSLGKVLYEICTGKDRHEFPALPTLLGTEAKDETSLLELNSVFLKACQSDVKLRYQTAEQMRDHLLLLQSGKSVKRAQAVERRMALLARVSALGILTTILILAALLFYWFQFQRAERAERETRRQLYVSDMIVAEKALSEGNIRRAVQLLNAHLPKPGDREDLRGFEHYYLTQKCVGDQLFMFPAQAQKIFTVAYSPSGKLLATGSSYWDEKDYSGELKLFDVDSRTEIHKFILPAPDGIRSVTFSSDGKLLASGTAGSQVTLWDATSRQELKTFFGGGGPVRKLAFSPDGKLLAGLFYKETFFWSPGEVTFWDMELRQETNVLELEVKEVCALAFSPDGKTLALVDWLQNWWLCDISSKRVLAKTASPFESEVRSMAFSTDTNIIALGLASGFVALWRPIEGEVIKLGKHQSEVVSAAFSRDGTHLVTGSMDGTIKLWDPRRGREARLLKGHAAQVQEVVFSPDGTYLASASHDKTARLWAVNPHERDVLSSPLEQFSRLDSQGFLAAAKRRWSTRGLDQVKGHTAIGFSPDGKLLAATGSDRAVRLWALADGKLHKTLTLTNTGWCVAFSPDGNYLAAGGQAQITIWNTRTWQEVTNRISLVETEIVKSLNFSHDGKFLFAVKNEGTGVWEVGSWHAVTNLPSAGSYWPVVTSSADSKWLATGANAQNPDVAVWEVGTWAALERLVGHKGASRAMAFMPDNRTLVTGSDDSTLRIWDIETGRTLRILEGLVGAVWALAISPDGRTLAVSDMSGAIHLWNLATGKQLFALVGHGEPVSSLAFAPDGRTLASGGFDTVVRLWRTVPSQKSDSNLQKR